MAFGKRTYKKAFKGKPAAKSTAKKTFGKRSESRERQPERRPYGGRRSPEREQGDANFIGITGMFPTKKGNSFQVFIKPEHLEVLQDLEEGDSLGVTPGETRDGREIVRLWVKKAA